MTWPSRLVTMTSSRTSETCSSSPNCPCGCCAHATAGAASVTTAVSVASRAMIFCLMAFIFRVVPRSVRRDESKGAGQVEAARQGGARDEWRSRGGRADGPIRRAVRVAGAPRRAGAGLKCPLWRTESGPGRAQGRGSAGWNFPPDTFPLLDGEASSGGESPENALRDPVMRRTSLRARLSPAWSGPESCGRLGDPRDRHRLCLAAARAGGAAGDPSAPDRLSPYVQALRDQGRVRSPSSSTGRATTTCCSSTTGSIRCRAVDFFRELLADPDFAGLLDVVFLEAVPLNQQPALDAYLDAEDDDRRCSTRRSKTPPGASVGRTRRTSSCCARGAGPTPAGRRRSDPVVGVSNRPGGPRGGRRATSTLPPKPAGPRLRHVQGDPRRDGRLDRVARGLPHQDPPRLQGRPARRRHAVLEPGTFLHRWHPGKTYSLRIHNLSLFIEAERPEGEAAVRTTEGMERMEYHWGRMADGLWDSAFAALGDRP